MTVFKACKVCGYMPKHETDYCVVAHSTVRVNRGEVGTVTGRVSANQPNISNRPRSMEEPNPKECDPGGCPGWSVFNGNEIQRCDNCKRFEDDDAAIEYVKSQLQKEIAFNAAVQSNVSRDMISYLGNELQAAIGEISFAEGAYSLANVAWNEDGGDRRLYALLTDEDDNELRVIITAHTEESA